MRATLLLLLACDPAKTPGVEGSTGDSPAPDSAEGPGGDGSDGGSDGGGDGSAEGSDGAGDSGVEHLPSAGPAPCPAILEASALQDIEVWIDAAEWRGLESDYAAGRKEYHPITFTHEGTDQAAHIRLKGNPDFSWFTDKMQFVISFNEADPEGRYAGLRKLSLDATWYEPTLLRDRATWTILRRVEGLPSICAGAARLTVNGEYYGLYTLIEYLDREWLERHFGEADATGTLWKYGTEAVSNAEASTGVVRRFWRTTDVDELATLGDIDEWLLEWAAEAAVGQDDGYWCCAHNFYLYEHPRQGLLFVPWDMDDNFDVQGYDVDPIEGYPSHLFGQAHFEAVVRHPDWGPRYIEQLERINEAMDPDLVLAELEASEALIADALAEDPHRSFTLAEHEAGVQRMAAWVIARHAYLQSWTACAAGESTDADGDGHGVCDDPHDRDASISPTAPELCNGVDDDANGWIDDLEGCDDCALHSVDDSHFLFCRWPRSNAEAQLNCADRGGALAEPATTAEYYLSFFYTWPVLEHWWTSGSAGGGRCGTWDEASFGPSATSCIEPHPSICRLSEPPE